MDRPPAKKLNLHSDKDVPASTTKPIGKSSLGKTKVSTKMPTMNMTSLRHRLLGQSHGRRGALALVFDPDLTTEVATPNEAMARLWGLIQPTSARKCRPITCTLLISVTGELKDAMFKAGNHTKESWERRASRKVANPGTYASLARWRNDVRTLFLGGPGKLQDIRLKITSEDGSCLDAMLIYGFDEVMSLQEVYQRLNADGVVKAEFSCTAYIFPQRYEDDRPYGRTAAVEHAHFSATDIFGHGPTQAQTGS
ncbi:hypothetical protein LTR10_015884 [Elasticomyces elasticus]|nr:hypothetical protein LTR10_015884 [Elasticomyces elasticus]KAK4974660.1 hypothetical protein LTR42_005306 [Elasticomyces elasticus]